MNYKVGDKVRFTEEVMERFNGMLRDKVLTILSIDWTKNCPIRLNTIDKRASEIEYFKPEELYYA